MKAKPGKIGMDFLKPEKKDFWFELSEKDRQEIDAGIKQLDSGERIPLDDFLEKLDNPKWKF